MKRPAICLIGNPVSGTGRTGGRLALLESLLRTAGCHVDTFLTSGRGSARQIASSSADGADIVVVAGGDGTVNEVVNGLPDPASTPIAIMPTGGANVLARELRLPVKPDQVAAAILAGRTRPVDLGTLDGGHRFLVAFSAGFDASVVHRVEKERRGTLGMRGFVIPAIRTAIGYAPPKIEISVDGGDIVSGALVVVANTRAYGGIMRVADDAACDSGRLEVVVLPRWSATAMMRYGIAAVAGRLSYLPEVTCLSGTTVSIAAETPTDCQADGDPVTAMPTTLTASRHAACVVVPA